MKGKFVQLSSLKILISEPLRATGPTQPLIPPTSENEYQVILGLATGYAR